MARGGRAIADIAEEIRVRPHHLEALEADDYDRLPGLIYAAGFIRAYAQYLGLDGDDLVARFRRTARTEDLEAHLAFPEPLDDPRIPRRSLVAIACTLALAVYGTWYGFAARDDAEFEDVPPVEARLGDVIASASQDRPEQIRPIKVASLARPAPEASPVGALESEKTVVTAGEPAARPVPVKRPEAAVDAAVAAAAPQTAEDQGSGTTEALTGVETPEPSEPVATRVLGVADSGQITVRARQDAWVRIEGPGDAPVIDRVLKAGEAYDAPSGRGLYMMTGNAGALDILVDGKPIGVLGPQGEVRRHVALDASLLRPADPVQRQ